MSPELIEELKESVEELDVIYDDFCREANISNNEKHLENTKFKKIVLICHKN